MEETASIELGKRGVKRPMNAFLIFCKRHRGVVREKNPNVDNRAVTRILGDLWANLDVDEKSIYTNLAKQVVSLFLVFTSTTVFSLLTFKQSLLLRFHLVSEIGNWGSCVLYIGIRKHSFPHSTAFHIYATS